MTTQEVINFAEQQFQAGRAAQAEGICRQVLEHLPNHPPALNLLGMALASQRRFDEAIAAFTRLAEAQPDNPDAQANLALALHQAGHLDQAESTCRLALRLNANHFGALVTLGNVLQNKAVQRNHPPTLDAAIAVLRQVAAQRPDWGYAHFNLANALCKRGRHPEALESYRTAAAILPGDANIKVNLGTALHDIGDLTSAAGACEQALALDPNDWRAHNNLGRVQDELGLWPRAIESYQRALALRNDLPEVHKNIARTWECAGHTAEAIAAYERILHLWPADTEPYWNLCRLCIANPQPVPADCPYVGDKVVLLECSTETRRQVIALGLNGGCLVDPDTGADRWLAEQVAARQSPDILRRLLPRWLENLRDEAAMSGTIAIVWLPEMPASLAGLIRELAGSDLIEIRSDDMAQIRSRLAELSAAAPPRSETADQIWAIVSIRNGGLELLPHWLDHYQRLGCHRLLIGLFDDLQSEALAEIDRCRGRWSFQTFSQRWEGEGDEFQYAQRRAACRKAGAEPATWIINTDLDELHQFPAPLAEITRAAADAGVRAIHGHFADRVTEDGSFPAVFKTPLLWEQFPMECDVTGRISLASTKKVMLSRYSVRVNPGHHDAANAAVCRPPIGDPRDYKVAHFRWNGALVSRLRWGLEQPNASLAWKRESRRLLAWLDAHGGRIDLHDSQIEARRAERP